jgi:uncharacterized RDD family membrane protein YckC
VSSYAAVAVQPGAKTETSEIPRIGVASADAAKMRGRDTHILRVRAARFPRRLAAAFVDVVLIVSVSVAVAMGATLALGVHLPSAKEFGPDFVLAGLLDRNPMVAGALGLLLAMSALYQVYLGGILGQTVGKRLLRLRVISSRGRAPSPVVACVRFFAMGLSLAPAGLGWLWCIFDRERRSLHDRLSGTYVIVDER